MALKLVSSEDYAAIANLMGAYQQLVDQGNEDGYADLFTEDGAFIGLPEALGPSESFRGREGLKRVPRLTVTFFGGKFRHHMGSFSAEYGASRDEAFARYYILATSWVPAQGPKLEQFVDVVTHLVRIDGAWKIKSNTMSAMTGVEAL